jgi:hypothetical protein
MKPSRLRAGEAIALISALALFVLMFLDWFGAELSGQAKALSLPAGAAAGGSAWQTLEVISIVLMLTIASTIGAVALRLLDSQWEPAIPPVVAVAVLGGLSTLLIGFRIVYPPDLGALGGVSMVATRELGVFLGLAAAAGIAYGSFRAMGERGTSFAKVADRLSAKPPPHGARKGKSAQVTRKGG